MAAGRAVLVLNGPNLNMLGKRDPAVYGSATLADVERICRDTAARLGLRVECRQSNDEGHLIDAVHAARDSASAIVINAGGYSHTSVALMDALSVAALPVIEVHISNIHAREKYRHRSYVSLVASGGIIIGCGVQGYALALHRAAAIVAESRDDGG